MKERIVSCSGCKLKVAREITEYLENERVLVVVVANAAGEISECLLKEKVFAVMVTKVSREISEYFLRKRFWLQ